MYIYIYLFSSFPIRTHKTRVRIKTVTTLKQKAIVKNNCHNTRTIESGVRENEYRSTPCIVSFYSFSVPQSLPIRLNTINTVLIAWLRKYETTKVLLLGTRIL